MGIWSELPPRTAVGDHDSPNPTTKSTGGNKSSGVQYSPLGSQKITRVEYYVLVGNMLLYVVAICICHGVGREVLGASGGVYRQA